MEEPEKQKSAYETLGIENLTDAETVEMVKMTSKLLFTRGYKKSDAVIDLIKLFKMEDTKANRKFCLSSMAFGALAESSNSRMKKVMQVIDDMIPEIRDEEK